MIELIAGYFKEALGVNAFLAIGLAFGGGVFSGLSP